MSHRGDPPLSRGPPPGDWSRSPVYSHSNTSPSYSSGATPPPGYAPRWDASPANLSPRSNEHSPVHAPRYFSGGVDDMFAPDVGQRSTPLDSYDGVSSDFSSRPSSQASDARYSEEYSEHQMQRPGSGYVASSSVEPSPAPSPVFSDTERSRFPEHGISHQQQSRLPPPRDFISPAPVYKAPIPRNQQSYVSDQGQRGFAASRPNVAQQRPYVSQPGSFFSPRDDRGVPYGSGSEMSGHSGSSRSSGFDPPQLSHHHGPSDNWRSHGQSQSSSRSSQNHSSSRSRSQAQTSPRNLAASMAQLSVSSQSDASLLSASGGRPPNRDRDRDRDRNRDRPRDRDYQEPIYSSATQSSASSTASKATRPGGESDDGWKKFQAHVRTLDSFAEGIRYCEAMLTIFDTKKPKIFLEMAELAKRDGRATAAKKYFRLASQLQPDDVQIWLEWAKQEEELGNYTKAKRIIDRGLEHNPLADGLALRGIKLAERCGDHRGVRRILGRVRTWDTEKSWKAMSEGAAFEAKLGNVALAREVFAHILQRYPLHGPVYTEAVKLEERCQDFRRAILLSEAGMQKLTKFGPVWVNALRLYIKMNYPLDQIRAFVARAVERVPSDLRWKFWFELGKIEERSASSIEYQRCFRLAAQSAPSQQLWKVWLGAARTELMRFEAAKARDLLDRASQIVPRGSKPLVILEQSRLEEFEGRSEAARAILSRGRADFKADWKLVLEGIIVEYRSGRFAEAIRQAEAAISAHPGTGRLWAILIALKQSVSDQDHVFKMGTLEVAKSGEVWCEGARLRMNPLSPLFDLVEARRFLDFAIQLQFTPQYGDSFIEYIRLEMLCNGPSKFIDVLKQHCMHVDPNYGALWAYFKVSEHCSPADIIHQAIQVIQKELYDARALYAHAILRSNALYRWPAYAGLAPVERLSMAREFPAGNCILCKMTLKSSDVVVLACNHMFHKDCGRLFSTPSKASDLEVGESVHEEKLCALCGSAWVVEKYFAPDSAHRSTGSLPAYSYPELRPARTSGSRIDRQDNSLLVEADIPRAFNMVGEGLRNLFSSVQYSTSGVRPSQHGRLRSRKVKSRPMETDAHGFYSFPGYTPHDFTTGVMKLNQDTLRMRELIPMMRERLLFGSDSVSIL